MKTSAFLRWGLFGAAAAGGTMMLGRWLRRGLPLAGKAVFITGGSRGLGLALAREFARHGARVAVVARDKAELERAKDDLAKRGAEVWTGVCDLRDREQISAAIREAADYFGALDILVNNAGILTVGPLESMTDDDFNKALAVHFWAPYFTMNAALPHLKGRDSRIVNIVSIGGKVGIPHMAPYTASKFGLAGLSHAYRSELLKYGVRVTTVFPGLMRTGSHLNALFKGKNREEFRWVALGVASPASSMGAARAARQIVRACRLGKPQLIVSRQARLMALAAAVFPNLTEHALGLVNRSLPGMPEHDHEMRTGWESGHAAGREGAEFNELRGQPSPAVESDTR